MTTLVETWPEAARRRLVELGAVELVIGLPTFGPTPTLPGVAAAVRAGVESAFAGRPAVAVHVDDIAPEEMVRGLEESLGALPLIRLPSTADRDKATGAEPSRRDDAIRAIFSAGTALGATAIVVLNGELTSTTPAWVAGLGGPVLKDGHGFVLPVYQRSCYEGTLTQALVVPLIRALFSRRFAHPIAEEFGCSGHVAQQLLAREVWGTELGRSGLEFWLPAAAADEGAQIGQAVLGPRVVDASRPGESLGATVGRVASALFAIAEELDALWLEVRGSKPVNTFGAMPAVAAGGALDALRLLSGFRQGVRDLFPVWERILAPETLGEVLVLGDLEPEAFRLSDRLWAHIVYDFVLASHARVMYQGHLAQSLAALYLGRTASLVLETRGAPAAVAEAGERLAQTFESEKPYLVDRWQ